MGTLGHQLSALREPIPSSGFRQRAAAHSEIERNSSGARLEPAPPRGVPPSSRTRACARSWSSEWGQTRRLSGVMRRRTRFSGTCVGRGRPRPFSNAPLPRLWLPVRLSAVTFAGATPPVPPTTLTLLISSPVSSHAHRVGDASGPHPPFSLCCFILLVHLRPIDSFLSF